MKKKILCLVLAIAMMLSLSAMVLAEEEDTGDEETTEVSYSTSDDVTTVTFNKTYTLVGEGVSPEETFEFTIDAVSAENAVVGVDKGNMPVPADVSVEYEKEAATTVGYTQKITISLPGIDTTEDAPDEGERYENYIGVGVYTYEINETAGNTAGVTYDDSTLYLVVTVIEGTDGQLKIASVHAEDEANAEEKTDTFKGNTYTANSLTVSKDVTGILGDTTKQFSFTVVFTAPTDKVWVPNVTVSASNSGNVETPTPETDTNGNVTTYTYKFTLADDEYVTFANIPAGVTYTVTESDYTSDGYRTTTDTYVSGTMASEAISTTVTNAKGGTVDTGVILESMPYVMILAVVVVGGIALISKKKVSE